MAGGASNGDGDDELITSINVNPEDMQRED